MINSRENVIQKQTEVFLKEKQSTISFRNEEEFSSGRDRFAYGFHTELNLNNGESVPVGFIKTCRLGDRLQLAREALAANLAAELSIPTVACLTPLTEINGLFLIEMAVLKSEDGVLLSNNELVAGAEPEIGVRATQTILSLYKKEIPTAIDTSILNRSDGRNESSQSFWRVWQEQNNVVLDLRNQSMIENLVGTEKLKTIVDLTSKDLEPLLEQFNNIDVEYLVHNDIAPNNLFFDKDESVVMLDWEHIGATHNSLLAQVTDLGNFYGRCWPNPEMQKFVLSTILCSDKFESVENRYKVAKIVAVFGSMYLSKYAMDNNHPEHKMAVFLLGNLQNNLAHLDVEYQSINKSRVSLD